MDRDDGERQPPTWVYKCLIEVFPAPAGRERSSGFL
jgi:hypothetical protein